MFLNLNFVFVLLLICAIRVSDSLSAQTLSKEALKRFMNASDDSPTKMPSHSTETSTEQHVLLNHNITTILSTTVETITDSNKPVTTTKPTTTPLISDVSDKTSNQTYKGGTGQDEMSHHQHPSPKEVSRINHSKPPGNITTLPVTVATTTSSITSSSTTSSATTSTPTKITSGQDDTVSMPIKGKSTSSTAVTGIVAFVCVGIAATAFVSLLAYKYLYRKRHGNREILINEEDVDFNDEDLRHFELKLLNKEGKVIQA